MSFCEIIATDILALFFFRTRTRENTYTLEELAALGITEQSVTERLSSSHKGWLCENDGFVVAFCMAERVTGELWVIAVLPQYEGRGIGNKLMGLAEEWLWATGCTRAWLMTDVDANRGAYGFYRRRGWTDWKLESDRRWMELQLRYAR